ncbi:GNAT family N-acetyltransferase [Sphingomonas sp. 8AM]|uniref:GNAT family N-acetyltransferase n=1 Tax=Sphingomonas sp. 8AM TaxID=2653170 RepID=UPI001F413B6E|nr:GNAT family N-acetyltransferase [Sphingomonas sp. 8AM]
MELRWSGRSDADPVRGWVPSEDFAIVAAGVVVGAIVLRLGDTEALRRYGGQVGYRVAPEQQRRGYATAALRLLMPIAVSHGFAALWITCRPENVASRRVLDKVGARFVELVETPADSDLFARGDRRMCRYLLDL